MLSTGTVVADWELVPPQMVYHPVPQVFPETVMPEYQVVMAKGEEVAGSLPSKMEEMIKGVERGRSPRDTWVVYVVKGEALGRTDVVLHEIDTWTARPSRIPPRRALIHQVEVVEQTLEEM